MAPEPGTLVSSRWRKFDGSPHWASHYVFLGEDENGSWLGQPAGWLSARPGRQIVAAQANLVLIPSSGTYAVTLNAAPHHVEVYNDLAWDVVWSSDALITGIDMDLDVVRVTEADGRGTWIDDEDEWAEHSRQYGYPADVMREIEALAQELKNQVEAHNAPYDDATAGRWFAALDQELASHPAYHVPAISFD